MYLLLDQDEMNIMNSLFKIVFGSWFECTPLLRHLYVFKSMVHFLHRKYLLVDPKEFKICLNIEKKIDNVTPVFKKKILLLFLSIFNLFHRIISLKMIQLFSFKQKWTPDSLDQIIVALMAYAVLSLAF